MILNQIGWVDAVLALAVIFHIQNIINLLFFVDCFRSFLGQGENRNYKKKRAFWIVNNSKWKAQTIETSIIWCGSEHVGGVEKKLVLVLDVEKTGWQIYVPMQKSHRF